MVYEPVNTNFQPQGVDLGRQCIKSIGELGGVWNHALCSRISLHCRPAVLQITEVSLRAT